MQTEASSQSMAYIGACCSKATILLLVHQYERASKTLLAKVISRTGLALARCCRTRFAAAWVPQAFYTLHLQTLSQKDWRVSMITNAGEGSGSAHPDPPEPTPVLVTGALRWYALVSLVLLAACLAEFLTGSTPILRAITQPLGFLSLVGLYGGGALLIREAAVRWGKRWGAVLLLGGAYAVGEEGFAAKTMIDPMSPIIGNQVYSHWMGVNWVALAGLTLFHAAFSITVPLVLVELLFPRTKGRRLLGGRGTVVTLFIYGLTVFVLTFFLGDPYVPSLGVEVFLVVYASAFIAAAFLAPKSFLRARSERPDRRERNFLLLGAGFMGAFFAITGGLTPGGGPVERLLSWQVAAALCVPLAGLTAWYLVKHAGRSGNELVKIDFLLGVILVFVPIDITLEVGGDTGVLLFTGLILAILVGLRRRAKQDEHPLGLLHDPEGKGNEAPLLLNQYDL